MPEHGRKCHADVLLRVMSGSWTSYIIYVLTMDGPHRFGALQRRVGGISTKVLTERLRMLERADLVHRDVVPTIPPQVTYSLTDRGAQLSDVMNAIGALARDWGENGWSADFHGPKPVKSDTTAKAASRLEAAART